MESSYFQPFTSHGAKIVKTIRFGFFLQLVRHTKLLVGGSHPPIPPRSFISLSPTLPQHSCIPFIAHQCARHIVLVENDWYRRRYPVLSAFHSLLPLITPVSSSLLFQKPRRGNGQIWKAGLAQPATTARCATALLNTFFSSVFSAPSKILPKIQKQEKGDTKQ